MTTSHNILTASTSASRGVGATSSTLPQTTRISVDTKPQCSPYLGTPETVTGTEITTEPQAPTLPPQDALAYLREVARPGPRAEAKPTVKVPGGVTSVTQSAEQLFGIIGPKREVFYRGGAMVRVVREQGRATIQVVEAVTATSLFEKYVGFAKTATCGTTWFDKPTIINEGTARQYLKSDACRTLLPALKGIVHSPLLVERDGRLHQSRSGYDPATEMFVAQETVMPELPLPEAVALLNSLLEDFRFQTPGDRSRALASFLTPALKFGGFIRGPIPIEVAEANASQSGKSFRQQLVAAVYGERMGTVTKKQGDPKGLEETFQKQLSDGRAFIQIDNLRGKIDSQMVEAFVTARDSFPVRIAFHPHLNVDPSKQVLFISSNGFESTKDLANRSSIVRILKREQHNFRLYDGRDLVEHVFHHHIRYLSAVYAVIGEWHRAGKPRTEETGHDFHEWCQICDWIIQQVFRGAPLMEGHAEAKERAANPNLTFFRSLAVKLEAAGRLNVLLSASNLAEFCADLGVVIPGLSETNENPNQPRIQVGKAMKAVLDGVEERRWEGYRLTRTIRPMQTDAGNQDNRTSYTISRLTSCAPGALPRSVSERASDETQ